jgi:hypothetical protein
MWASLGALVQNGHGNRHAATLNAIGVLYTHCLAQSSPELDAAFDSVIVQIVPDLDPETIVALAPAVDNVIAQFPNFAAIFHEHMAKIGSEPTASTDISTDENDLETSNGFLDDIKTGNDKFQSELTDHEPAKERRQHVRDPILDTDNPITLARLASQDELFQIAGLPDLPEALTNVLISRGDRTVLERVLNNRSAVFAKSSLTTLAELAASDRMIKESMIARHDLPESIVERILPYLSSGAKARVLLSGASFSHLDCETALEKASTELISSLDQGQIMLGLDHCLATINEGQTSPSDIVSILTKDARIAELAAFAAIQLGISQTAAFNALSSRFDHAAVIILRGLDCNAVAFDDAMNMRRRCGCREAKETKSAWNLSQRYSVAEAMVMARCMDDAIEAHAASNLRVPLSGQTALSGEDITAVSQSIAA